jgi:hypothetical protein
MVEKTTSADAASVARHTAPAGTDTPSPIPSQPPSGTIAVNLSAEQWKQICNSFEWARLAIAEQQPNLYTQVVVPQAGEPQDVHAGGKKLREQQNKATAEAREEARAKAEAKAESKNQ